LIKIKFNRTPYKDRHGRIISSIAGKKNRPGIDEFSGGDKIRPDVSKLKILDSREFEDVALLFVDNTEQELNGYEKIPNNEILKELKALLPFPEGTTIDDDLSVILPKKIEIILP